jgi:hypothetical protein
MTQKGASLATLEQQNNEQGWLLLLLLLALLLRLYITQKLLWS